MTGPSSDDPETPRSLDGPALCPATGFPSRLDGARWELKADGRDELRLSDGTLLVPNGGSGVGAHEPSPETADEPVLCPAPDSRNEKMRAVGYRQAYIDYQDWAKVLAPKATDSDRCDDIAALLEPDTCAMTYETGRVAERWSIHEAIRQLMAEHGVALSPKYPELMHYEPSRLPALVTAMWRLTEPVDRPKAGEGAHIGGGWSIVPGSFRGITASGGTGSSGDEPTPVERGCTCPVEASRECPVHGWDD